MLDAKELKLVKRSVGLVDIEFQALSNNLRLHGMTQEQSRVLIQKALNAKVIVHNRGRYRMSPPPPDPRALSDARVNELMQLGYGVYTVSDNAENLYAWQHGGSGAAQSHFLNVQPYRRTREQAWVDCNRYAGCDLPSEAEPDWKT